MSLRMIMDDAWRNPETRREFEKVRGMRPLYDHQGQEKYHLAFIEWMEEKLGQQLNVSPMPWGTFIDLAEECYRKEFNLFGPFNIELERTWSWLRTLADKLDETGRACGAKLLDFERTPLDNR